MKQLLWGQAGGIRLGLMFASGLLLGWIPTHIAPMYLGLKGATRLPVSTIIVITLILAAAGTFLTQDGAAWASFTPVKGITSAIAGGIGLWLGAVD